MTTYNISPGLPFPFGASFQNGGINFAIFAKNLDHLALAIFHENDLFQPYQIFDLNPLINKTGNVWHLFIQGLPPNAIYGFQVKRKGEEKSMMLLDPYAKAVIAAPHWIPAEENSYHPLGQVIRPEPFDWEGDIHLNIPMKDLVLYEMHVRGFTRDQSSLVAHPGTYLGLIDKIPYLNQLGINAVELMPVHEFDEGEVLLRCPYTGERLVNYFGYSPVNYFAPMSGYATSHEGEKIHREFKEMVKAFHQHGIEVILDVVFNHTAEGNEKGPILSFKGFDRKTYYMIDNQDHYRNYSGCGNTVNSNHPIVIDLIIEALRYWVTEMHVDGFRFDLASIMTRSENGVPLTNPPLVDAIAKDPVLSSTKLIAEAWDAAGLYQVGAFMPKSLRWYEWNGKYRDTVRCFINGRSNYKSAFATAICGSQDLYGVGRAPYCSVNFVTAHDGFSLADLVSYNMKHNYGNGEGNRDGFDYNDSWNCGVEGHTSNRKVIALRQRQMRNFFLALMISQGVPMMLMGDEYGHTRDGNNNTWCQDNELNWFLWNKLEENKEFFRYCQNLIALRKEFSLFRREAFLTEKDIVWHGIYPNNPDWGHDNRFLAFTLKGIGDEPSFYAAFNASADFNTIQLPITPNGKQWHCVVNTENSSPNDFFETPIPIEKSEIKMIPHSALLLKTS